MDDLYLVKKNRLRPADLALFVCNLKVISFSRGAGVLEAGAAMDHIYFL